MSDKVSNRGAAELMNVTPATWRSAVSAGKAPAPDGREEVSGNPWWFAVTVTTYRDNRPGMGTRPGHGRRAHERKPWPLCDCSRPTYGSLWQHDAGCAALRAFDQAEVEREAKGITADAVT